MSTEPSLQPLHKELLEHNAENTNHQAHTGKGFLETPLWDCSTARTEVLTTLSQR